jgi:hypothetical protein
LAQKSGKPENKRQRAPRPTNERSKPRTTTLPYEDRPAPPRPRDIPFGSSPELITIDEVGRATLAAIEDALRVERLEAVMSSPRASSASAPEPAFVFEISTFVVEGIEIFSKASDRARRDFVAKRLLHRLPVLTIDDVERIDVSPGATPNTVILRVWSKVSPPSG